MPEQAQIKVEAGEEVRGAQGVVPLAVEGSR